MKDELKNKVNRHASEVDPLEIWGAIEPRVDALNKKKKRKRRFFFIIFSGIGVASLLWLLTYSRATLPNQQTTNQTPSTMESPRQSRNSQTQALNDKNYIPSKHNTNTNKITEPTPTTITPTPNDIIISAQNTLESPQLANEPPMASRENHDKNNKTITPSSTKAIDKIWQDKTPLSKSTDENNITTISNQLSRNAKNTNTARKVKKNKKTTSHTPLNADLNIIGTQVNLLAESKSTLIAPPVQPIESLGALPGHCLPLGAHINYQAIAPSRHTKTSSADSKYFNLIIGANSGIAALSRTLAAKNSSDNNYKMLRDRTESMLEAINFGADLTMEHTSGFSLSLGFNQVHINERFRSINIVIDTSIINDVKYRVINLMQDTVDVYGDVSIYDITKSTYDIYNQHRITELPILLGYAFNLSKWRLGVQAGALVNISTKSKGRIFNKSGEIIDISTTSNPYKTKIGMGYQFGFSIAREITHRLSLRAMPVVKIYPNIMNEDSALTNKYTLLGGQIGLSYKL